MSSANQVDGAGKKGPPDPRAGRAYKTSELPVLREECPPDQRNGLLLKLYEQTCTVWRELVGIRFKLLGLVPATSLALLSVVLSAPSASSPGLPFSARLLIAALGALVTIGLFIYDIRNSSLHDDLISRARRIEDELGVDTGVFRGRLKSGSLIKHGVATGIVYGSTILAWGVAIVLIGFKLQI